MVEVKEGKSIGMKDARKRKKREKLLKQSRKCVRWNTE